MRVLAQAVAAAAARAAASPPRSRPKLLEMIRGFEVMRDARNLVAVRRVERRVLGLQRRSASTCSRAAFGLRPRPRSARSRRWASSRSASRCRTRPASSASSSGSRCSACRSTSRARRRQAQRALRHDVRVRERPLRPAGRLVHGCAARSGSRRRWVSFHDLVDVRRAEPKTGDVDANVATIGAMRRHPARPRCSRRARRVDARSEKTLAYPRDPRGPPRCGSSASTRSLKLDREGRRRRLRASSSSRRRRRRFAARSR